MKSYVRGGDVILLLVVPTEQRWNLGPPIQTAIEDVRDYLNSERPSFREVVVLDEQTSAVLLAWTPIA